MIMKTYKHEIVFEMYFNKYIDKDMFFGDITSVMIMGINHNTLVNGDVDTESWILIPR